MTVIHSDFAAPRRSLFGAIIARIGTLAVAAFERAERSNHRRLGFYSLSPETLRDIGMSAEDATGLPSHEADLPFFLQPGFDRR